MNRSYNSEKGLVLYKTLAFCLLAITLLLCACNKEEENKANGGDTSHTAPESSIGASGDKDEPPQSGQNESQKVPTTESQGESAPADSDSTAIEDDVTETESFAKEPGESRPEDNMEIPFKKTKLYHSFDYIDKYHLYIRSVQNIATDISGYVTHVIEYAFSGKKIYIHQERNGDELFYYGDGDSLYGLDFEQRTYTLIAPSVYTVDEILYMGDFEYCSNTGKDVFLGEERDYEDYTVSENEWIRYYFDDDGMILGYTRQDASTNELLELTYYEAFTSEFPEDAVLYFDIPAGFEKYTDVIDYSDLWGEDY